MKIVKDFLFKRDEILKRDQVEKMSEKDMKHLAALHYHGKNTVSSIIPVTVQSALFTSCQSYFNPLCFFNTIGNVLGRVYKHIHPKDFRGMFMENLKEDLESDSQDPLKVEKLHVVDLLTEHLSKAGIPKEKWPKISFSREMLSEDRSFITFEANPNSQYCPFSNTINIALSDIRKKPEFFEHKIAHELGHFVQKDQSNSEKLVFIFDLMKFGAAWNGNMYFLFATNMLSIYVSKMHKSFREKEADRFAITNLNNGAEKAIKGLWKDIELKERWKDLKPKQQYLLNASISNKGVFGSHPTEYQRISYAMDHLASKEKKSSYFKELYRFLSTPFCGNLDAVVKSRTYLKQ